MEKEERRRKKESRFLNALGKRVFHLSNAPTSNFQLPTSNFQLPTPSF
jgi:hypothetical protein